MPDARTAPRPARLSTRRARSGWLLAAGLLCAASAGAQAVNVSRLVLGTASNQPLPAGDATPIPCQGCSFASVYAAGMSEGYTAQVGPLLAQGWPPMHGSSLAAPAAAGDNLGLGVVPSGRLPDGGIVGTEQRARVRLDKSLYSANPVREAAVQTWRSGSGLAVASHSVLIPTPAASAGTVPTFVQLTLPRLRRGIHTAYTVLNSGQYLYERPHRMQAGSTVDVYVDGLPVWSGSSHVLVPGRYTPSLPTNQLHQRWGEDLAGAVAPVVTLFLGHLPSGSSRQLTMVVRSEAHLDAQGCQYDTDASGVPVWRCHSQVEALSLPAVWSGNAFTGMRPAIDVFTR